MNNKGQVILILILVMTVALAIGLSIVQKSLTDVSTATKVEESSRAFSAAEAGIEKALGGNTTDVNFSSENNSSATINDSGLLPCVPGQGSCASGRQTALEFPPLAKEDTVQVWLADYTSSVNPPPVFYNPPPPAHELDVYWGNSATDKAALELTLVYYEGGIYKSQKWYLESDTNRATSNGFDTTASCIGNFLTRYQCNKQLTSLPSGLMLIRARLLYNTTSQPFAVQAVGICGKDCSLPPQARTIVSTGASGETQRSVKLFQFFKVAPPFFDYAIFSAGDISK